MWELAATVHAAVGLLILMEELLDPGALVSIALDLGGLIAVVVGLRVGLL